MKILLYGFGATPIFFCEFIKFCRKNANYTDFYAILPTSHHLLSMQEHLEKEQILCISKEVISTNFNESLDKVLASYAGNIFRDIETEKITLKHRSGQYQTEYAAKVYNAIKSFAIEKKPDYILFAQPPEGIDGMILSSVATELSIPLAVPHHTRNLGLSFFSHSPLEVLPKWARPTDKDKELAQKFLNEFRNDFKEAAAFYSEKSHDKDDLIRFAKPNLAVRTVNYVKRILFEVDAIELSELRVAMLNNLPFFRNIIWNVRKKLNGSIFEIESLGDIPENYIFYPLQYSPESSINIPAPYFIDQCRIIDAIRFAMPSDYVLVVKEHPSCIKVRPRSFIKKLKRKAGVKIAKYDLNTQELIKNSKLTISITGTAAFEAFLYGRPSLVFGQTFFSDFLGGVSKLDNLEANIRRALAVSISNEYVINAIATIISCSEKFLGRSPGEAGEGMMRHSNLRNYLSAFKKFVLNEQYKEEEGDGCFTDKSVGL
jgi:hypothetical protein